jgi:nucleoside-diphosphate-sugar epimerase
LKNKKNILLTGCTGMLGLSLLNTLKKKNKYNFIILYRDKIKIKYLKKNLNQAKFIYINLAKPNFLKKQIKKYKIYAVIHMASSKMNENLSFESHLSSNFKMTLSLLNSIKNKKIIHFIYTNTAAIYKQGCNLQESSPKSNNPYGFSKYIISKFIENFCLNNKIFFKDLRIFSVFGENENKNRLTTGAILHALNHKNFLIKAPKQLRDYLYVDDVTNAIAMSLKIKQNFSANICSGNKVSTYQLVKTIFNKISNINLIKYNKKTKFAGSVLYKLTGNNKIAKKKIGWTPKYNLNSGINLTIKKLNNYKLC